MYRMTTVPDDRQRVVITCVPCAVASPPMLRADQRGHDRWRKAHAAEKHQPRKGGAS